MIPICDLLLHNECTSKTSWLDFIVLLLIPLIFLYTVHINIPTIFLTGFITFVAVVILQYIDCKKRSSKAKIYSSIIPALPIMIAYGLVIFTRYVPLPVLSAVGMLMSTLLGPLIVGLISYYTYKVDISVSTC
jgi:hypothetical protein